MFSAIIGYTLVLFVLIGMVLAMCGIWGVIKGEVASKLFATSLVMCLGIVGCAYSVKVFVQGSAPNVEEEHRH